jgi:hypothetical protein
MVPLVLQGVRFVFRRVNSLPAQPTRRKNPVAQSSRSGFRARGRARARARGTTRFATAPNYTADDVGGVADAFWLAEAAGVSCAVWVIGRSPSRRGSAHRPRERVLRG